MAGRYTQDYLARVGELEAEAFPAPQLPPGYRAEPTDDPMFVRIVVVEDETATSHVIRVPVEPEPVEPPKVKRPRKRRSS